MSEDIKKSSPLKIGHMGRDAWGSPGTHRGAQDLNKNEHLLQTGYGNRGGQGPKKTFVDVVALYSPLLMALVPTKNIEYFVHSRADVCEKRPFSDPKIG